MPDSIPAAISIDTHRVIGTADPMLFGGFIEHMGRCIYGGVFDDGSPLSDANGFRTDVIAALQELAPPILRYPGGNFVSQYHWLDGVGPVDERPQRRNLAWGMPESNRFGTNEFIAYCRVLGTEPFLCVNLGTGTPEEAAHWVEYCNSKRDTAYANLRRAHGYEEPHKVKYWGLGNEMGGSWQIGYKNADDYAKIALEAAKMMRLEDPSIKLVACGALNVNSYEWNLEILSRLHGYIDYIALHHYCGNKEHDIAMGLPLAFEKDIERFEAAITLATSVDRRDFVARLMGDRPIKIAVDEWNVWFRTFGNTIEENYNLTDALVVAGMMHVMQRHCRTVTMAQLAQMVNVIAPVRTTPDGLWKQTLFHALALQREHFRPLVLDTHTACPASTRSIKSQMHPNPEVRVNVPVLDVLATTSDDKDGVTLSVINRSATDAVQARFEFFHGAPAGPWDGWVLTADDPTATNLDDHDAVIPAALDAVTLSDGASHTFPPCSLTILTGAWTPA